MSTDTLQTGELLIEQLGLPPLGREGHDVKLACIDCDSSDAMRVHCETGVGFCHSCKAKWSPYKLALAVLGDVGQVKAVLVDLGIFEPRDDNGAASNPIDLIERLAKVKNCTAESLQAYGATIASRNGRQVVRFPVYNETGEAKWQFDVLPGDPGQLGKGKLGQGHKHGLFIADERLPQPSDTVFLCEGVKDAAKLHELGRTAIGLPTSSLAPQFARLFRGVHVFIIPDRDKAGETGAQKTAAVLHGVAASVHVVTLPGEFKTKGGLDVRDVVKMKDGEKFLRQAIEDAVAWEPTKVEDGKVTCDRFANVEVIETVDEETDKRKTLPKPLMMVDLLKDLRAKTDDWPRRVGTSLFVHDGDCIAWLSKPPALFGWAASTIGRINWSESVGCVTKGELFAELKRKARDYRAVELHPREPALPNVYCTYPTPEPGDGTVLRELLDRFCPATDIDRDLIQAAFMTGLWGGPPGSRPAFVFTSDLGRGTGKSTVAQMVGRLFGGTIDFSTKETIKDIKTRLLSSEALVKRIALLDNIKSLRFSWAELEGLITADEINGHKMFVGDGSRPNTLTWFLTLNGASLSTDMAQRSIVVKVKNPKRSATWEEDINRFIHDRRAEIIADLVGCLRAEQHDLAEYSRWATWERGVLSRLPEPGEAQKVILERQAECDAEAEDNSIIEEHFGQQLERLGYATDREEIFIPSAVSARWLNWATNDKQKTGPASRMLKQMIGEGSVKRLRENKCKTWGRGFVWEGENVNVDATVRTDLIQRLGMQKEKSESQGA